MNNSDKPGADTVLLHCGPLREGIDELISKIFQHKHSLMAELFGMPDSWDSGTRPGWNMVPVADIVVKDRGILQGASLEPDESAKAVQPVVTADAVRNLRFVEEGCFFITEETAQKCADFRVGGGTIFMVRQKNDAGKCAILPVFHGGAVCGGECIAIRADGTRCNPFYLNNLFHHCLHTGFLGSVAIKDGVIDPDRLANMRIPIPPIRQQKAIADMLLMVSACIVNAEDAAQRIDSIAEKMQQHETAH